jgi:hypothetical protein
MTVSVFVSPFDRQPLDVRSQVLDNSEMADITADLLEVPYGYCHCGCGLLAPIAKRTDSRRGYVAGEPTRFINHHATRVRPLQDPTERYWSQVDRSTTPDGCWPWIGALDESGYGRFWVNGRYQQATHIALELAGWIIPFEWLEALHLCDNPGCVRPDHLKIGTTEENNEDRDRKGRQARGERQGAAKLRQVAVEEIRRLYVDGGTQEALAQQFSVSPATISKIVRGETWQSAAYHADEKATKGRQARGERIGSAVLTEVLVQEIRRLHQPGVRGRGSRVLAKQFGVGRTTIESILENLTWKHVA